MGMNIVEKIIKAHLVEGEYKPGSTIGIKIDQTLTQDATGTMAYLQFESIGVDSVKTELSVSYIDHNTTQIGFENMDDHLYLTGVARKYGIKLSRAGNGICHQVHLERFGKPGKTLLGSDSHTPTCGGIGMLAIGAGGLDVAVAMAGGPFSLQCPKVVKINLKNKLRPWVSAKDVILKVLEIFTTKGNVGVVFEYGGEGVATLSVPERATITNMGAETGVTTSIFPSDEVTRQFLKAQGREKDWIELLPDPDAKYDKVVDIDLAELEPLIAVPHSPGNIKKVKEVEGIPVTQVCIGSCTNSSYRDLMIAAGMMKGRHLHPDTSLALAPGSRQVLEMIARNGALADILAFGARLAENACGFCIGNSLSPASASVSLRTSNRNFEGRSGTADAQVYLCSVEVAVAAAIAGKIIDPRELGIPYPEVKMPDAFLINDSMIEWNEGAKPDVVIRRGPNIGEAPKSNPLKESISGVVSIKVGDKITTDHIIPAGARMKYRSNIPKYSEFVFENVDKEFAKRAAANRDKGIDNIIVGGLSYGQGSSREHAAICPMYLGVKAVIAKSFERIHTQNLINFGILPLVFKNEADYDKISQGDEIEIPDIKKAISEKLPIIVKNKTKGFEFEVNPQISDRDREVLIAGGTLAYVKSRM